MVTELDKLPNKHGFQLGDWYINPMSGKFIRNGVSVHVEPKLMDVLLCLANSPEEVVTRDELMCCVWEGMIVSDEALTRCISELRTLLGDTARERQYIRTVPKRGYSLMRPVVATLEQPVSAAAARERKQTVGEHSIAVLPFSNLCSGNEYDYFCDGLTEELINALARITQLRVAARTSTFAFKGRTVDIREIGRQLNVSHVLEGSVRIAGDKLRITAQLISVVDGFQLWAEIFERDQTGIFSIQEQIATAVAHGLNLKLGGDKSGHRLLKPDTENLEAYKWYLQGRRKFQTEQPGVSYTGMEELEQAVALDPGFADACGLLAYLNILHTTVKPYQEVAPPARKYYQQALALNPEQPEALMAKAIDTRWQTWDWRAVHALFKRALQAAPNNPTVLIQFACRFYRDLGCQDRAEELLRRAIENDPLNAAPRSAISYVLRYKGQSREAIKQAEIAIQLSPQYGFAHLGLILALITEHEFASAQEKIGIAEKFQGPDFPALLQCKARLYAQAGDTANARRVKSKMIKLAGGSEGFHYIPEIGWVCMALGELEEALYWMNKTLDLKNSQIVVARASVKYINDRYQTYLQEPLFQAFLRRMNLDDRMTSQLREEGLIT